jgi:hypothetical protein
MQSPDLGWGDRVLTGYRSATTILPPRALEGAGQVSNFKLNLPTDIPWRRKCVSRDMLDPHVGDQTAPLRWRSSIAIFEYEPDADSQNYAGMNISYLKVVCSITGY